MTTIVTVIGAGRIVMATDTMCVDGDECVGRQHFAVQNIFRYRGTLVGITGPRCAVHAANDFFMLNYKPDLFAGAEKIYTTWLGLHTALWSVHHMVPNGGSGGCYESSKLSAMVANKHGAYVVAEHRSVDKILRYHAVGSGEGYALGAMAVLHTEGTTLARAVAISAIAAAAEFDSETCLPARVYSVALDG